MSATILIVEDEVSIRNMLRYALEIKGFNVVEACDVRQAQQLISEYEPALVLLDWMLPQTNGIHFVKQLKQDKSTQDIAIIMLTAKAEEEFKLLGFDAGVDDYITKPFSPRELIARVQAVLRRGPRRETLVQLQVKEMTIDAASQLVSIRGELLKLGRLEYRLLTFFAQNPDRVYSRDELLNRVWGSQAYIDERTVDVHIRRLRKHLKPYGYDQLIQTVHGSGYRFSEKQRDEQQ